MSKVDLVILGLLSEQARHGYDILQQIENRDMNNWVGVSTPAIYKGLARLERKRVLKARKESSASHPDRTVYEITPEGRDYFHRLMREALSEPKQPFFDLLTGVGFAHLEDKQVLVECLRERRDKLTPILEFLGQHCKEFEQSKGHPITADWIIGFYQRLISMELEWLNEFIGQITKIRKWPEGVFRK